MDKPEQNDPQNDPFYQLMKGSRLHLDSPGLEEDILRRLRQSPHSPHSSQSPHSPHTPVSPYSPHNRPSTRASRLAILFLSIAVIWGLALTALYATHYSPVPIPDPSISDPSFSDPSFSLFLTAMLVLTFLFLLEKIIQLLMYRPDRRP
jgi:hypothetical protein